MEQDKSLKLQQQRAPKDIDAKYVMRRALRLDATTCGVLLALVFALCSKLECFTMFKGVAAQKSVSLHVSMNINKGENMTKILEDEQELLAYAKSKNVHQNLLIFLQNTESQLKKLVGAAAEAKVERKKAKAVSFTTGKYRLKEMKKLRAKKDTIQKYTMKEFEKKFEKKLEFAKPFIVKNAGPEIFKDFAGAREKFNADELAANEYLEKNTQLEYWKPGQSRQVVENGRIYFNQATQIPFSRHLTLCYLGTPAAPKIPGQATEYCEQTISALKMVEKDNELDILKTTRSDGTALVENVLSDFQLAASSFFKPEGDVNGTALAEVKELVGEEKGANFVEKEATGNYRYFVFGPSGSGEKLRAENGLPFYDVLIHGYRRWLILGEEELNKVAEKAKEALEFQQTSAYMFFEEKLPELREEFGLKKYMEVNQEVGDVIFVPPGWFRVSLSLADSISYYEQLLYQIPVVEGIVRNTIWNPNIRQFNLGFCYPPADVVSETGGLNNAEGNAWMADQFKNQVQDSDYPYPIMQVLTSCAKILGSEGKIANLIDIKKTKCSQSVWKSCRGMLVKKAKKLNKSVALDWIPEKFVAATTTSSSSSTAAPTGDKKKKKEEL